MAVRVIALALLCLAFVVSGAGAQEPKETRYEKEDDLTSGWEISGEYEVKLDSRNNFALDKGHRDDLIRFDQEFQLRASYRYSDWITFLIEGKILGEHQLYTGGGRRKSIDDPERGETWVRFDQLFGRDLSLKVGRQPFEEPRRWWWDDDLDAVALRYRNESWFFELGAGRELPRKSLQEKFIDAEDEGVIRVLARADWLYYKNHGLSLFFLHQNDTSATQSPGDRVQRNRQDESDAKLWWGGLRAIGSEPVAESGELSYWADLAMVLGGEKLLEFADVGGSRKVVTSRRSQQVRGWAVDAGGRWETELPGRPMFIIGYAVGSGDKRPDSGPDFSYRQTGLQTNDEEFRTYGEILRPELSNLSIPVLAVRFPIFSKSHIEFAYRHFQQLYAVPFLRDARIKADPDGVHRNIGQEWMLYSIIKQWKKVEIELVAAAFRAGGAYGSLSGQIAYSFFTKISYEF
jgi:hypothetical protein